MQNEILKIHVLGPVEITSGRETIKINRRIERAILYILAVEHRPVSRTTMIDLLWPNADQIDPRAALRTALSRLKRTLPAPEIIKTELDTLQINLNYCEVDLVKFENHVQSLQNLLNGYPQPEPLPKQIVNQLQEALTIWRGDNLLHGENLSAYPEIEIWLRTHDQQYRQQRQFLMKRLAQHYQAIGQPELALEQYLELGRLDILDIPTHLVILDLMIQLGRINEAIEHCDLLETAYEKQFNAPLPEAILQKCQLATLQTNNRHHEDSKSWQFPLSMQLSMVGREEELSQLRQSFFSGGGVVVWGKLGVGKTRLVQELIHTSGSPSLFFAPCRETEAALPFSPIIQGLRNNISQDIFLHVSRVWANHLQLLIPELAEIRDDIDDLSKIKVPFGKQHLFEALHQLFLNISKKNGKILFFLDDAQWADNQTLQALSYLVSKDYFKSNGLLVIAARNVEPPPKLIEMIDRFSRSHPFQIINLLELNPDNLRKLTEQALNRPAPPLFLDKLYRESQGNPLFALEIIRNILDSQEEIENLENLPLPTSLQTLIKMRLHKMDEISRRVLLCAAVLGQSFPIVELQSLADLHGKEFISNLYTIAEYGLINPVTKEISGEMSLNFAHDKVRDVILQEAMPLELYMLHKKAAELLIDHPQKIEKAHVIANHYLKAGELKAAFQWFIKAALHARSLDAKDDALDAFGIAENLLNKSHSGLFSIDDILALYNPWANLAYEIDDHKLLEEIGVKLQSLGYELNAPLLNGVSYIALANSCLLRLEHHTAMTFIQRAIQNLQQKGNESYLARAYLFYGIYNWWELDFDEEIAAAQQTIELCNMLDKNDGEVIDMIAHAGHMISMAYYGKGNAKQALYHAQEVYDNYYPHLHAYHQVRALDSLCYAHLLAGNYQESEQYSLKSLDVAKGLENDFVEEFLLITRAKSYAIQGLLDQAYQDANRQLALGEENKRPHTLIAANTILGDIFFTLQNPSKALQHYRIAEIREGFPLRSIQGIENSISLARVLTWMRQLDEAERVINQVLEISATKGMQSMYTQALILSGYCDLFNDKNQKAKEKFDQAKIKSNELGLKYEATWIKKAQARLALTNGELALAETLLQEALEESQHRNFIWINLLGWRMFIELMEEKKQLSISPEAQSNFRKTINKLEMHTRSYPLRNYFEEAKRKWANGPMIP